MQSNILRLTLIGILSAMMLQPLALNADELYTVVWRGTEYLTSNGRVVARSFSEKRFVAEVANNYGINPADLVLVYRPEKRDVTMVRRSTGAFVASIIQMEYVYTDVSNQNQSSTVRQAFLFDEYHDASIGTAFGTERVVRNASGAITGFSFRGRFNYAHPDQGTVYAGTFSTGRKIIDRTGN